LRPARAQYVMATFPGEGYVRSKTLVAIGAALQVLAGAAAAQPVEYSFSTGVQMGFGVTSGTFVPTDLLSMMSGSTVSGTFLYDSSSAQTGTSGAASVYGTNPTTLQTSYSALSGSVGGGALGAPLSFGDTRGFTLVWNDSQQFSPLPGLPPPPPVDGFQLQTDNFGLGGVRNLTPFSIGDYTLWNVRMFWFESQATPELIPDFLDDQSLPDAPPTFHGRLALDFKRTGQADGLTQYHLFYDQLTVTPTAPVPEPETYAMLLAGLALLGFTARRRSRQRRT
jgi:hypothetical protein